LAVTPLLGLALLVAAPEAPAACPLLFPVAGDVVAARRIAEAVIGNALASLPGLRRRAARLHYILRVMPDQDGAGQWVAFQSLPPPPPPRRDGGIFVQAGGGGLGFRIDRCTGAISQIYYQR
jgi:hypothetical protein